jgi:excisionase family DNA binding protein
MDEDNSSGSEANEIHQETDPDDPRYGSPSPWILSLKSELFDDLTTEDVCFVTGLDKSTVLKYLKDGTIEGYQLGRSWRVTPDSMRKFKEHLIEEAKLPKDGFANARARRT